MHATSMILLAFLAPAPPSVSVEGRLAWPAKAAIPENPPVMVGRDAKVCLSKGKILKDEWVIHPKNRGIKNAAFFLVDARDPKKILPTPRGRKLPKEAEVVVSCCTFEPRIAILAPGQSLVIENMAAVAHAATIQGGEGGPNFARLIPPGRREEHGPIGLRLVPAFISCPIHPWMRAYVFAPPSPHFAVTDADGRFSIKDVPKGRYRLVGWHERIGWIFPREKMGGPPGKVIEIGRGGVDLGAIERDARD